jgi:hypothetical protein
MSDQKSEAFETWGILELFGHLRLAGKLSEQTIAGGAFIRIDVPELPGVSGYTRFFGHAAVYGMTPTDEQTARAMVANLVAVPVQTYDLRPRQQALTLEDDDERGPF